jgi:hypothetical protein
VIIEPAPREYLDTNLVTNQTYFYWVKGIDGTESWWLLPMSRGAHEREIDIETEFRERRRRRLI